MLSFTFNIDKKTPPRGEKSKENASTLGELSKIGKIKFPTPQPHSRILNFSFGQFFGLSSGNSRSVQ